MNLIRKNIIIISLLTISLQLSIIFSFVVHNHSWHYLKLFPEESIDTSFNSSNKDPFVDESGVCRINHYFQNNFSFSIIDRTNSLHTNALSSCSDYSYHNHYKFLFYFSSGLRGPPLA